MVFHYIQIRNLDGKAEKYLIKFQGGSNGIFPASIDPRKNISAFVASMEKSRLSEIKFIAGAR